MMKWNHFLSHTAMVTACVMLALTCSGCGQSDEPNDSATTTSTVQTTVADAPTESTTEETAEQTTESAVEPTKPTAADSPTTAAPVAAPATPAPLSDAQQLQIRQDYYDAQRARYPDDSMIQQMALSDVTVRKHIATYGDSIVLFIDCPSFAYDNAFWTVEYEGLSFHFTDGRRPLVYRGGEFVTYQKAFEDGWLTRDDLYDLSLHFQMTE